MTKKKATVAKKTPAAMKPASSKKRPAPAKKAPAPARSRKPEAKSVETAPAPAGNIREVLPAVEAQAAAPAPELLVACRFCGAKIPKPEGTVYECDEHKNFTGSFKSPFVRE